MQWDVDGYDHLTQKLVEIIKNGRKSAAISKAVYDGLNGMEDLDPFYSIEPLLDPLNECIHQSNETFNVQNAEYSAMYQDES